MTARGRLLLSQIDCRATCGQEPTMLDVDQSVVPTIGYQYDSNFTVSADPSSTGIIDFLIQWIASPIIICRIICPQLLNIGATRSITQVDPVTGLYDIYVLGNKTGYLGDLTDKFQFNYSEDWTKYRVSACSGALTWCGKEIDKNGVVYTSRISNKDDLTSFDPQMNADNVVSNVDDVITVSCQHAVPIYNWKPLDPNDEVAETNNEHQVQDFEFSYDQFFAFQAMTNLSKLPNGEYAALTTIAGTGNLSAFATELLAAFLSSFTASGGNTWLTEWIGQLNGKYGNAFASPTNATQFVLKARPTVTVAFRYILPETDADATYKTFFGRLGGTDVEAEIPIANIEESDEAIVFSNPADLFNALMTRWAAVFVAEYTTSAPTGVYDCINMRAVVKMNFKFNVPGARQVNTRAKVSYNLSPTIADGASAITPYDDDFRFPVSRVVSSSPFFQVFQQVTTELQVQDGSPFTELAVAHAKSSRSTTVQKREIEKFARIMEGMPPALVMGQNGLNRLSTSMLDARGIIGDIAGFLGGAASTFIPGAAAIVGPITGLIDSLGL